MKTLIFALIASYQLLKDAMRVHMYAPQVNASNGLEVLRALEQRNRLAAPHKDTGSLRG